MHDDVGLVEGHSSHAGKKADSHDSQAQKRAAIVMFSGGTMRIAALVLGIIGAILGIIAALVALSIGGIGRAVGAEGGQMVVSLGWWSLLFVFLAFIGSGFALAKPKLSGTLLLFAAIGFIISISWFAVISGPLFLMASIFAFMGSGRRRPV